MWGKEEDGRLGEKGRTGRKQAGEETSERRAKQQAESSAVVERLAWQTATRDDQRVAQAIHSGQEIEAMHELSEAGLLDGVKCATVKWSAR